MMGLVNDLVGYIGGARHTAAGNGHSRSGQKDISKGTPVLKEFEDGLLFGIFQEN